MEIKNIDLQNYRGLKSSVFTGRPQGEHARKELDLDKLDSKRYKVNFSIPAGTTAITPSFFLGFLYNSIKKLGIETYHNKYGFSFKEENSEVIKILKDNIEEGERHASNTINQKRGVSRFVN